MEQLELPYVVKLNIFQGPLDLLIELIKKNKVDIYDIPIADITDQYLEYLEIIKLYNLETVGDYLSLAAELGYIKSRMLLPEPQGDDEEEGQDPREELVRRLLEYEKYREVANNLNERDILGREIFNCGINYDDIFGTPEIESETVRVDLWALVQAFNEFCNSRSLALTEDLHYEIESFSVREKAEEIIGILKERNSLFFDQLFEDQPRRIDLIVTFIALLEVVKDGIVGIIQQKSYKEIQLIYIGEE